MTSYVTLALLSSATRPAPSMSPTTLSPHAAPAPSHRTDLHDVLIPPPSQAPRPLPANTYRLQTSPLRGFDHHGDYALLSKLRIGDELRLIPEPANPHDRYAIRVHRGDDHIGYLPRESNHVVSRLLRQGAPLRAIIAWVDPTPNPQLPLSLHVLWDSSLPRRRASRPAPKPKSKPRSAAS